jgi:type I restriction-modification system DNA methylase subunit
MARSKIRGKPTKIPIPFEPIVHRTERTATAALMHWMRGIIEEKNLALGMPDVETAGSDGKMPDIVIYESPRSQRVLCVIEAKPPYYDVFDYDGLKKPAWEKANRRKAKYFAVTNFKKLIWFNTERVNSLCPEEEQIIEKYFLSEIENLDEIEQARYSEPIKRGFKEFLTKLHAVHTGREPEPKQAIDDFLIFRLQEKIRALSIYYRRIIEGQCHKGSSFGEMLKNWFISQGWSFAWQPQDFDKVARQTAYLLVNKILFYNLLQAKRPHELDPLEVPEGLTKGAVLQTTLQGYFNEVLKIDYETIYTTDFIDSIAFPDSKEVVKEVKELINVLRRYDFSKLGYDVIGRIFEQLIPQNERHNLGQYFTNPDVVDLILRFCLQHEDDKILDPACGAGTFLVRAYQHKKLMNQRKGHEEILETLWGIDIAKFPAHLATINLAINDLSADRNYPNILQEDFFSLLVGDKGFDAERWRKVRSKTLGLEGREIIYPRWFDVIVGNPPYTRQEEISEISPDDAEYKRKIIENALKAPSGRKLGDISKRAGIYAYFFVHGTKFLKNKGYFGFIVSNSWLDVDYGKGLQEFLLKNYKIIVIIESKIERWFEEADINTCIIVLQKCKDKRERDENLVRFVYLKKPLRYFIPPAQDMWEKQLERLEAIDKLKKNMLAHSDLYENEELRVFPKSQEELWNEGFDPEENRYIGAKWGRYLRAPEIFFKILEKGKGKLVPLKEVATVRRGFTTGANEFFYLPEEEIRRREIEREFWMHPLKRYELPPVLADVWRDERGTYFQSSQYAERYELDDMLRSDDSVWWVPNYVIKSPQECRSIVVNPEGLKYRILMIHRDRRDLKGTKILKYIEEGERRGFHKRPTCAGRGRWYDLSDQRFPDIVWFKAFNDRVFALLNEGIYVSDRFYGIYLRDPRRKQHLTFVLNSTLQYLFVELGGRVNLGEGALDNMVYETAAMLVLHPATVEINKLRSLRGFLNREISSIFSELGVSSPEEISLDKVMSDRRELDGIIMGEILGLTEEEQLEVYRAVVDLVKSRLERAKSVSGRRTKEGIDIDLFTKTVMEKIGGETLGKFYRERILSRKDLKTITLFKPKNEITIEHGLFGCRISSGRDHIECNSEEEARYLKVFIEAGMREIKMPKDDRYLRAILPELESLKRGIDEVIGFYLSSISSGKVRERLRHEIWQKIMMGDLNAD